MKKLLFIIFICSIISCSNGIPKIMDGNWIITEMEFNGKKIYPESISNGIEITFNVTGFENAEKIKFRNNRSEVILPGFKSDRMHVDYIKNNQEIEFKLSDSNYNDEIFNFSKKVFLNSYKIQKGENEGELILKSKTTLLKIISEDVLLENQVQNIFDGI
ncbi:hypothetical protein IWQ47_001949 [Aquimarina sp. EL_43]|uniref:hypothetical protein n=1 Tax=unclassified Aquimarina TaxID=2627091 RepID=UPI0018CB35C9|nr:MULTISPECIES: hypothetical protein [unclassified Aquimarina]MBG6129968.1 hypothetical protein [Aquimarina sp. EL_35]MBG6148748.1 hypothetical protein [Aquimarina sp. EL_32]MBG6168878.1 hypothetical protein [Aquimarina sp. EL_43]